MPTNDDYLELEEKGTENPQEEFEIDEEWQRLFYERMQRYGKAVSKFTEGVRNESN